MSYELPAAAISNLNFKGAIAIAIYLFEDFAVLDPPRGFQGDRIVAHLPAAAVFLVCDSVISARERAAIELRPTHLLLIVSLAREIVTRVVVRRAKITFP